MGREKGTDKIEGGAFSGVNIVQFCILIILGGDYFVVNVNSELQVMDAQTPFMFKGGEGVNAGQGEVEWVVAKERSEPKKRRRKIKRFNYLTICGVGCC